MPFFIVSCVQEWRAGLLEGEAAGTMPWTVAQSVRHRVAALPPGAQAVLEVAAVAGRAVPAALLLAVATQSPDDVSAALEAACRARLLVDDEPGYRFAHDVIREVLEGDLGTARRLLLHERIAHALEHAVSPPADPETLAYHYSRSQAQDKAVVYLEQAGDRAQAQAAPAAAESYYRTVVERLDGIALVGDRARVREKLGVVLATEAQYDAALVVLEQAAEAYQTLGEVESLRRTVAQIGHVHVHRGTAEAGLARLQPLLARLEVGEASPGLAAFYAALALLHLYRGRHQEARMAAERGVDLARAVGDGRVLARAEERRGFALLYLEGTDEARRVLEGAAQLAQAAGDLERPL